MIEMYHTLVLFRSSLPKIIFLSRCPNNIVNMYFVLKDSSFSYNPNTFPVISQIKVWTSDTMRLFTNVRQESYSEHNIDTGFSDVFCVLLCYLTVPSNWFKRKKNFERISCPTINYCLGIHYLVLNYNNSYWFPGPQCETFTIYNILFSYN